jgi:hypothetical protein
MVRSIIMIHQLAKKTWEFFSAKKFHLPHQFLVAVNLATISLRRGIIYRSMLIWNHPITGMEAPIMYNIR